MLGIERTANPISTLGKLLVGVDLDQGDVGLLVTADHLGRVPAVVLNAFVDEFLEQAELCPAVATIMRGQLRDPVTERRDCRLLSGCCLSDVR